jgi:hypothetical protein
MSWKNLLEQGRAERHATSSEELAALRAVIERNLADARVEVISADTRFGCAYEAAIRPRAYLSLAIMRLVRPEGVSRRTR